MSTQNVNIARNVEWDFFCDFQTPCMMCVVEKREGGGQRRAFLRLGAEGSEVVLASRESEAALGLPKDLVSCVSWGKLNKVPLGKQQDFCYPTSNIH